MITIDSIFEYALKNFKDSEQDSNWGERGIFYNKDNKLKKGVYILTAKEKNGANDKASNLDRTPETYRLNIALTKPSFLKLFGFIPLRQKAGEVIDMDYDFALADTILPHPIYGWMCWISVINPTAETFEKLKPYLQEAYILAKDRYASRHE